MSEKHSDEMHTEIACFGERWKRTEKRNNKTTRKIASAQCHFGLVICDRIVSTGVLFFCVLFFFPPHCH